jgi:hypothetical protein
MASVRSFSTVNSGNSVGLDASTDPGPLDISAPAGLAIGDLYIVGAWFAQATGNSGDGYTQPYATEGFTVLHAGKTGTATNRLMYVWGKVIEDAQDVTDAAVLNLRAAALTTRICAIGVAIQPTADHHFLISDATLSALTWGGSAAGSLAFPAVPGGEEFKLCFFGTNNSSTSSHPVHGNTGGTKIGDTYAYGAASDPRADSILSAHWGGTAGTSSPNFTNGQTVTLGIDEVENPTSEPQPDRSVSDLEVEALRAAIPTSNPALSIADLRQAEYGRQKPYLPTTGSTADDVEIVALRVGSAAPNPQARSRADLRRENYEG